ncbi:MAG: peptidase M64 N-terminal domain-containing protein, partial [Candidatus Aminicenantales bacterium]
MKIMLGVLIGLALAATPNFGGTSSDFEKYFLDQTMRIDYYHIGNLQEEMVTLDRVIIQGAWAGSTKNLLDPFDMGRYAVEIYDEASGTLIFSRGFDSYFGEYRTTEEASQGIRRTYHESALIPKPKARIKFVVKSRDRKNDLHQILEQAIDPSSIEDLKNPLA